MKEKKAKRYDVPLIIMSVVIVLGLVAFLVIWPEGTLNAIQKPYNFFTVNCGPIDQICNFIIICGAFAIVLSKYGNIRMGYGRPKYSVFSWCGMVFTAGLGAACIYWGTVEWAHHYNNLSPLVNGAGVMTPEVRYEWAFAYHWLHWGPFAEPIYTICAVACGYLYYNKKVTKVIDFGETVSYFVGRPGSKVISKVIDVVFVLSVISSCVITVGLGLPIIRYAISFIFNIEIGNTFYYCLILAVTFIYYITSYLGIDKGLRYISDWNVYGVIVVGVFILFAGPTQFILDGYLAGVSLVLNNLPRMLLWLDPVGQSLFPQWWSAFNWLYMASFGPFTGMFLARISEGRTLRGTILAVVIGCPVGFFLFNAMASWFGIYLQTQGLVDVVSAVAVSEAAGYEALIQVFAHLPLGKIVVALLAIVSTLFLATTMDSSTYTVANIVESGRPAGTDPRPAHRLAWSIGVTIIPLVCLSVGADLTTFKSLGIVIAFPVLILEAFLVIALIRQLKKDYGDKSSDEILREFRLPKEAAEPPAVSSPGPAAAQE